MNTRWAIGLFFLIGFPMSCIKTASIMIPTPSEATKHHYQLHETLKTIFPEKCRFSARVTVTFSGKEMDFITYTVMNGVDIRSKAMGEFGGTLFDFLYIQGENFLMTFPEQLPQTIVQKGPARDLYHLFYMTRIRTPIHGCGDNCIFISPEEHNQYIFEFSSNGVLLYSKEYSNQKLICEVHYNNWKLFNTWGKRVPGKLIIIHHDPMYRFEIDILNLIPGIQSLEAFKWPENIK